MSTDIYLAAVFFHRSSLGQFHLSLSSSVFRGIFQSVTFSLLLIIQQSFLITSFLPKWKWNGFNRKNIDLSFLHLRCVFPQLSNTIWKWGRKLERTNKQGAIDSDSANHGQCDVISKYYPHTEFCCLWQICRLSKTSTLFQISLGEIVNILVFAWKCQECW